MRQSTGTKSVKSAGSTSRQCARNSSEGPQRLTSNSVHGASYLACGPNTEPRPLDSPCRNTATATAPSRADRVCHAFKVGGKLAECRLTSHSGPGRVRSVPFIWLCPRVADNSEYGRVGFVDEHRWYLPSLEQSICSATHWVPSVLMRGRQCAWVVNAQTTLGYVRQNVRPAARQNADWAPRPHSSRHPAQPFTGAREVSRVWSGFNHRIGPYYLVWAPTMRPRLQV